MVLSLICVGVTLSPGDALADAFDCSICHRDLVRGSVPHKPVAAGRCLDCHQQFNDNHPIDKGSMGFKVQKEKLCASCHGQLVQKAVLHKPVGLGQCTLCHMAHSAEVKSLLQDPSPTLCFRCHPKEHFTGSFTHRPVADGDCLACHDAHQSDSKSLLRKPGSELCFMCHDRKLATGKSVHQPVRNGDCINCHQIHGGPYRKLLKDDYPTLLYKPFSPEAFPLCFRCHDPNLVAAETTDRFTKFRNGERNLHAVHVKKAAKGRSCRICHNPHAEQQEHLIYPKAPGFGAWEIPIRYESTPSGGGCTVGCHKTLRYDRVKPVEQ
ncbi:cytochrome C [Geomonas sp. Red69]|uniref:Cytochrome C n=1 Tax=Geomonas diazotrophica TaxID=2843197 RepID=A0ABX8JP91_9BACT|nr:MULTISPECIES: cytochrome c3 family protein [Geomonas]MBU5635991.1 cytochrome C [Geomonas diazotrophica]QWV99786.1 cytochrome C [Geomonas nitrogeniifigens]QXE85931.1 cytochrome C [Geomonas nitrogeniifigens]